MKISEDVCAEIELRLVDGQRPADDPALAAHVRSCLRCFRTVSDLREVPHIAALLRDLDQPDPGELFWARFPKSVADAWQERHAPAAVGFWKRAAHWFQLPLPAAFSGAAVAAAVVLLLTNRPAPRPASTAPTAVESSVASSETTLEDEAAGLVADDDPLEALELSGQKLVANADESTGAEDAVEGDSSPVEEVELLDGDDLNAAAQALRGRKI